MPLTPRIVTRSREAGKKENNRDVAVGIAVLILAAIRFTMPHTTTLSWINVLLGMWLFGSPFLLSFDVLVDATSNAMIFGMLISAFGLLAAYGK
jgi:SPW repeat